LGFQKRIKMKVVLALVGLLAAYGKVELGVGLELGWEVQGEDVHFKFYVPPELKESYGWAGIGIKDPADGTGMANGDFVTVRFDGIVIEDRFGERNARPKLDTDKEGTDDIDELKTEGEEDGWVVYEWTRKLNTGDERDNPIEVGKETYIQWAYGEADGDTLKHHEEAGTYSVVFTESSEQTTSTPAAFISFDK